MSEEVGLYIKKFGDGRVQYRYGEPWVATMLWVEGGFATEEEAMQEWYKTRSMLDKSTTQPEIVV